MSLFPWYQNLVSSSDWLHCLLMTTLRVKLILDRSSQWTPSSSLGHASSDCHFAQIFWFNLSYWYQISPSPWTQVILPMLKSIWPKEQIDLEHTHQSINLSTHTTKINKICYCILTFLSKCLSSLTRPSFSPPCQTSTEIFFTSRPNSSKDGTPNLSSWSSETGVLQPVNNCTSSVVTGSSGGPKERIIVKNFLYVRGGVPPLFSMILRDEENLYRLCNRANK